MSKHGTTYRLVSVMLVTLLVAVSGGLARGEDALTKHIAFTSDRDGNANIYMMNVDGSGQKALTSDPAADFCPVFSPDGNRIAFLSYRTGSYSIYTMNWDGTGLQQVPNSQSAGFALIAGAGLAWSPDGQRLLFRPSTGSLATVKLDGSGNTTLLSGGVAGHDFIQGVAWGPTQDDVYFTAQVTNNGYNQHIFRYSIAGNSVTQVTQDVSPVHSQAPNVLPGGSRIVFQRQDTSPPPKNIYTMDLNGGNVTKLTSFPGSTLGDVTPVWMGSDAGIVFGSTRSGSQQIWTMDASGANLHMLTTLGTNYLPSWQLQQDKRTINRTGGIFDPKALGHYTAEFTQDNRLLANIRVKLNGDAALGPNGEDLKQIWENGIEGRWNGQYQAIDGTTKYPISVDVQWVTSGEDFVVTVHNNNGTGKYDVNSLNFCTDNPSNWGFANQGLVAAHEAGHWLGLLDEYSPENPPKNSPPGTVIPARWPLYKSDGSELTGWWGLYDKPNGSPLGDLDADGQPDWQELQAQADQSGLMGRNGSVEERYYKDLVDWLSGEAGRTLVLGQAPTFTLYQPGDIPADGPMPVPEPATLSLLAMGGLAALLRKRQ